MPLKNDRELEIEEDLDDKTPIGKNEPMDEADAARRSREAVFGKDTDDVDEDFEREEDSRLAYDEDTGEARDDRPSRRQRRNRARKEARRADAALIAAQNERIQRLEGAIAEMGRGQLAIHAGGIDQRIAEAQGHLAQIDDALGQAMVDQDKTRYARAMRLRDEVVSKITELGIERRRVEAVAAQAATRPMSQPQPQIEVDPDAARYSDIFMERHPWFDPTDTTDEDSQLVKAIDDALVNQGYKPNTARYWRELERRVEKRGLGKNRDDADDDYGDDYRPSARERQPARDGSGGLPPRSRRGGDGTARRETFDERRLPPLARDTLDQLGLLDKNGLSEAQLKEREGYISQWRKGLKAAAEAQR